MVGGRARVRELCWSVVGVLWRVVGSDWLRGIEGLLVLLGVVLLALRGERVEGPFETMSLA
jgi:hypothetical protein